MTTISIDRYLSALLAFTPCSREGNRFRGDYVSLIHVPPAGPEEVYSLAIEKGCQPILTTARYRETVWKYLERCDRNQSIDVAPQVNILQAAIDPMHPVLEYLDADGLSQCGNIGDGQPGMDYYMLLWKRDGEAAVVESWEPYGCDDHPWLTLISAMQALSSQFEYAAQGQEFATA